MSTTGATASATGSVRSATVSRIGVAVSRTGWARVVAVSVADSTAGLTAWVTGATAPRSGSSTVSTTGATVSTTGATAWRTGSVRRVAVPAASVRGSATATTAGAAVWVTEATAPRRGSSTVSTVSAGSDPPVGSITVPTAERSPVVAVSGVAVAEVGVPVDATAALSSFGVATGSVMRSTVPVSEDAMPGAVRFGESLGDGASSDGVGLFAAVVVLAGTFPGTLAGVLARVLVSAEALVAVFIGAGVVVSVSVAAVVVLAVFFVAFGLPDSAFASASGDVASVRESAFVAFFSAELTRRGLRPVRSSSVARDFLLSAFSPSDEDESLFSSLAFVSLSLCSCPSDSVALVLGAVRTCPRTDRTSPRSCRTCLRTTSRTRRRPTSPCPSPPPRPPGRRPRSRAPYSPAPWPPAAPRQGGSRTSGRRAREPGGSRRGAGRGTFRRCPSPPCGAEATWSSAGLPLITPVNHFPRSRSTSCSERSAGVSFQAGGTTTKRTP